MNAKELIMHIMKEQSVSNAKLAKRIGITNAAIWDRLNNKKNKSLRLDVVIQMLAGLDYKVVAIPADKNIPDGGYELK